MTERVIKEFIVREIESQPRVEDGLILSSAPEFDFSDTDDQTLSLDGSRIVLEDGGSVDLTALLQVALQAQVTDASSGASPSTGTNETNG